MKVLKLLILINVVVLCAYSGTKDFTLERSAVKLLLEGIEFKPFRGMTAEEIKPLNEELLTDGKGGQVEVYDFSSLWIRDQKLATYKNPTISVTFYKLNYLPPNIKPLWKNFIKEADFKSSISKTEWNESAIKSWFKSLTGKVISFEDRFPKLTFTIEQKWVSFGQKSNSYDLLINTKDGRFYYLQALARTALTKEQVKSINDLVKSIRIGRPQKVVSSNQSNKVKKTGAGSAKYEETVKKVIQEVANTKGWWYAKTPNYILKSNLDSRSKIFAKKVQVRVELMRKQYETFIPPEKKIDDISVITIPNTRDSYIKYAEAPSWSAGVWSSSRKELVVSPLKTGRDSDEKQMMETLHHEAFHQYIYYALNKKITPPWFNEGHAELFAYVKVIGSKVTVIESEYSIKKLEKHFKSKSLNISTLLNSDYRQFYAKKDINYPFAWSLIYFLRKAGPLYEAEGYDQILNKFLYEMKILGNMKAATKKAFEKVDMAQFQEDFYEFWNEKKLRARAAKTKLIQRR